MHPYIAQVVQEERSARMRADARDARRGVSPPSAQGRSRLAWIRDHVAGIAARAVSWRAAAPLAGPTNRVD